MVHRGTWQISLLTFGKQMRVFLRDICGNIKTQPTEHDRILRLSHLVCLYGQTQFRRRAYDGGWRSSGVADLTDEFPDIDGGSFPADRRWRPSDL